MKKPSYPSKEALLLKRKRAGATKKKERSPKRQADKDKSPRRSRKNRERSPIRRGNVMDRRGPPQPKLQLQYSPQQYTPITASVSQIIREVQHKRFLRWPSQMTSDLARRDDTKYYEFHKGHGNRMDDCIQLKKEIEYLIRRGHLSRYVASEGQERVQPPPPYQPTTV